MIVRDLAQKIYTLFDAESALHGRLPPFEDLYALARRSGEPSGYLRFGRDLQAVLRMNFCEISGQKDIYQDDENTDEDQITEEKDNMEIFIAFLIIAALIFIGIKFFTDSRSEGSDSGDKGDHGPKTLQDKRSEPSGPTYQPPKPPAPPETKYLLLAVKSASLEALGFGAYPAPGDTTSIADGRTLFEKTEYMLADQTQRQIDVLKERTSAENGDWAFVYVVLDGAAMAKVRKNSSRLEKRSVFDSLSGKQMCLLYSHAQVLPAGLYTKDTPLADNTEQSGGR